MPEYDNTNTGALWMTGDCQLLRRGAVDIEGEKETFAIIQTENRDGEIVYEMYQRCGRVYPNERKQKDTDPDMSGNIYPSKLSGPYKIWLRKRESKKGTKFTAVSIAPKIDNPPQQTATETGMGPHDDEIPF